MKIRSLLLLGVFAAAAAFPARALVREGGSAQGAAGRRHAATHDQVTMLGDIIVGSGQVVSGETRISRARHRILRILLQPERVRPLRETLEAVAQADLITMGPGSLFTSVIPNLLVSGVLEPARFFGRPVRGLAVLSFSGISVRG